MNQKISITLPSEMVSALEERVEAGLYASTSDVIRAALNALDREEHDLDGALDAKIREALAYKRAGIPAGDVFSRLEKLHSEGRTSLNDDE